MSDGRKNDPARTITIVAGVLAVVAIAVMATFYVVNRDTEDAVDDRPVPVGDVDGKDRVAIELKGVPELGSRLGGNGAPVHFHVFLDPLQRDGSTFLRDQLPELIATYVRTKRVQINFNPLPGSNESSIRAAKAILAASNQDGAWRFIVLLDANLGPTDAVTTKVLENVAAGAGLDVRQFRRDLDARDSDYEHTIERVERFTQGKDLSRSPSFQVVGPAFEDELAGPQTMQQFAASITEMERKR